MIACYLDFEYNRANEAKRNLVSLCMLISDGTAIDKWLYRQHTEKVYLKDYLLHLRDTHVFVAFNVEAEAGSFIALGLDPTKFKWIDLQKEWKMLTNHCDEYGRGEQLIQGKVKKVYNSSRKREMLPQHQASKSFARTEHSLAACAYKMIGKKVDTKRKTEIRDLILGLGEEQPSDKIKSEILDYNADDVVILPDIWKAIKKAYRKLPAKVTLGEILYRGETSARTALIECRGYPVAKCIKNFAFNTPKILGSCAEDINEQFPDVGLFVWNKSRGAFTMKQAPQKDFIEKSKHKSKWPKTPEDNYSLSLDAWQAAYGYRSPYPRDIFPAQIIRYLRLKQSLNGFLPKSKNAKNKETFFDSLGGDYRVRPYLNAYGSQSARWQPQSRAYIPLKASWMRYFIQPKGKRIICGIDYKSQEFLIAALLSGDQRMVDAYRTGDVYLAFGKEAKILPKDADKSHPLRPICKQTVLAIQYLMGSQSLAFALSEVGEREYTQDDAQNLIDRFNSVYRTFDRFRKKTIKQYKREKFLKLRDGWVMYGNNGNHRSVANMPIQGTGSVILRKAIKYCQQDKLKVILPLHDALYVELTHKEEIKRFQHWMKKAFVDTFPEAPDAEAIMLDTYAWGKHAKQIAGPLGIHTMTYYVEDRSKDELERFSKYFIGEKR